MVNSVISYPTPIFQNPPIQPQYFVPWRFEITGITLGITTIVTMSIPAITQLNYVIGQEVRLLIPPTFGCRQLNQRTGFVLSIVSSTQVELGIFSVGGDQFIASSAPTKPQIIAIGDINNGTINANGPLNEATYIPGSFLNVSPN